VQNLLTGEHSGLTDFFFIVIFDHTAIHQLEFDSIWVQRNYARQLSDSIRFQASKEVATQAEMSLSHLDKFHGCLKGVRLPSQFVI